MKIACVHNVCNAQKQPMFKKGSGQLKSDIHMLETQIRKLGQDVYHDNFPNAGIKELGEKGLEALNKPNSFLESLSKVPNEIKERLSSMSEELSKSRVELLIMNKRIAVKDRVRNQILSARANNIPLDNDGIKELYSKAEQEINEFEAATRKNIQK